jgi:hypothetical protein
VEPTRYIGVIKVSHPPVKLDWLWILNAVNAVQAFVLLCVLTAVGYDLQQPAPSTRSPIIVRLGTAGCAHPKAGLCPADTPAVTPCPTPPTNGAPLLVAASRCPEGAPPAVPRMPVI